MERKPAGFASMTKSRHELKMLVNPKKVNKNVTANQLVVPQQGPKAKKNNRKYS
jgi:hypothetical protein